VLCARAGVQGARDAEQTIFRGENGQGATCGPLSHAPVHCTRWCGGRRTHILLAHQRTLVTLCGHPCYTVRARRRRRQRPALNAYCPGVFFRREQWRLYVRLHMCKP